VCGRPTSPLYSCGRWCEHLATGIAVITRSPNKHESLAYWENFICPARVLSPQFGISRRAGAWATAIWRQQTIIHSRFTADITCIYNSKCRSNWLPVPGRVTTGLVAVSSEGPIERRQFRVHKAMNDWLKNRCGFANPTATSGIQCTWMSVITCPHLTDVYLEVHSLAQLERIKITGKTEHHST